MEKKGYLLSIVLVVFVVGVTLAAGGSTSPTTTNPATNTTLSNLAKENAELKSRIDQLDKEIAEIKKSVGASPDKKSVWSNLDIELYGYIKLDAAYDSARLNNGNYIKWVESGTYNGNDDQFSMTANETRLGFNIKGPKSGDTITSGKIEADFYGAGDAENKPQLMLRHAYLKIEWPESKFDIIAGQTSDVISPLTEPTLNYTVGWWTGNIGYRRPQIRFTKQYDFVTGGYLKLESAVTRTIGTNSEITDVESGKDAGFPTIQGRASITVPTFGPDMATIGLSGHWGEEEYETSIIGQDEDFQTWSLNLDYTQPICSKVAIKGEIYSGKNLDAYLGGIGQGVNTTTLDEIGDKGGWIAASLGPWSNRRFNIGISRDSVERGDIETGERSSNNSVFGNMICSINEQTEVGVELTQLRTEYKGPGDQDDTRLQLALTYKF
jgi:hypothetical protein